MTLNELKIGQSAIIKEVGGGGSLRQHFLDMGVIPGATVKLVKFAPMGDPMELLIHGYELTIRSADAKKINITPITFTPETVSTPLNSQEAKNSEHPGLGETGRYHSKAHENPLPKGTVLTFALVGNQNSGKTTLFNRLTGSNQHVGNFPGVTVDRKDGPILGYVGTSVTDLPGIYSLSPYTSEEIVSRQFILEEKPKAIINIVDASNIERNLYLTMQLMELNVPMVLALNMMDEVIGNGGAIYVNAMEKELGIPVVPISASKNEGINELIEHAVHIAKYQEKPYFQDFCDKEEYGGAVHRCLHGIMHLIEDHAEKADIPIRFAADKLIEGDPTVTRALELSQNEKEIIEHIICQMEEERGLDRAAAMADMRFSFIRRLCSHTVVKPKESKEHRRSKRIDRILTGKHTAIPSFLLIIALIFWLTFDVVGGWFQTLIENGVSNLTGLVDHGMQIIKVSDTIRSLVVSGIFSGVGSIISFIPIIIVLFFFLSLLEDSGYMARIAFVTDKLLRKIGLSGRSVVPMLISFGCSVPGIMSTRTLPSARDRKITVLLTPFMSCSAKIAIYGFFTSYFFPEHTGLIMISLYLLGILIGILMALIAKHSPLKSEAAPFVMELPNYRMPGAKNVGMLLWDKTKDFLQRAFTVIFIASIIVWFLQTFDFRFNIVSDSHDSILAWIAGLITPIFAPLGFGDWRIITALIAGFMAKESVVSTLTVLFGTTALSTVLSTDAVASLLVFSLLYTPCVASIAAIKRELSGRWALFVVIFQCLIAWICAYFTYLIF